MFSQRREAGKASAVGASTAGATRPRDETPPPSHTGRTTHSIARAAGFGRDCAPATSAWEIAEGWRGDSRSERRKSVRGAWGEGGAVPEGALARKQDRQRATATQTQTTRHRYKPMRSPNYSESTRDAAHHGNQKWLDARRVSARRRGAVFRTDSNRRQSISRVKKLSDDQSNPIEQAPAICTAANRSGHCRRAPREEVRNGGRPTVMATKANTQLTPLKCRSR
jgi:hypothetical protein